MPFGIDDRFDLPENRAVVDFIRRTNPSAHDDVLSSLIRSAVGLGAKWYLPDPYGHSYAVLHTETNRIYAVAFGVSGLAYRLPRNLVPQAVADGGEVCAEIGEGWVRFEPWRVGEPAVVTDARLKRWCKAALYYAVSPRAQRRPLTLPG